jgi:hypothetical protein
LRFSDSGAIEAEGRVEERHRGRWYALLHSPGALLVGVDEDRELPERHAVVFAGDLARLPFPELVSLIVHGRQSGVLRIYGSSATRTVVFSQGEVRGAYSDRVSERLGEVAVRMGLLKREDMDGLTIPVGDPRRVGRIAVEHRPALRARSVEGGGERRDCRAATRHAVHLLKRVSPPPLLLKHIGFRAIKRVHPGRPPARGLARERVDLRRHMGAPMAAAGRHLGGQTGGGCGGAAARLAGGRTGTHWVGGPPVVTARTSRRSTIEFLVHFRTALAV